MVQMHKPNQSRERMFYTPRRSHTCPTLPHSPSLPAKRWARSPTPPPRAALPYGIGSLRLFTSIVLHLGRLQRSTCAPCTRPLINPCRVGGARCPHPVTIATASSSAQHVGCATRRPHETGRIATPARVRPSAAQVPRALCRRTSRRRTRTLGGARPGGDEGRPFKEQGARAV